MSTLSVAVLAAHLAAVGYAVGCVAGAAGRARLRAALAAAERRAGTDVLTGLANRAALDAELACRAGSGEGFAVLLVDLDAFKPVNDRYGHAAGDAVLVELAHRLARLVPGGGFVARLGGDEFVLLTAVADARWLAVEVCRVAARPVVVDGVAVTVGASIGLAMSESGAGAAAVLAAADVALYRAKAAGGGRAVAAHDARQPGAATGPVVSRRAVRLRDMPHLATPGRRSA